MKIDEKAIDTAIEKAFVHDSEFRRNFLTQVNLDPSNYKYFWSRSNHPFSKFKATVVDSETGSEISINRESETDVLVVLQNQTENCRLALHIENKLTNGSFTEYQPQLYPKRAEEWKHTDKFKKYSEYLTILVAPNAFYNSNITQSKPFDYFVSYESLKQHISEIQIHLTQNAT